MSAPDSLVLADVMSAVGLAVPGMDSYRRYRQANGQPPPFGHDDPAALLVASGWTPDHLTFAGAPDANFGRLTRAPGHTPGGADAGARIGRAHLVTGRLPGRLPGDRPR